MNQQIIESIKSILPTLLDEEIDKLIAPCKTTILLPNETFITEGQIPKKFGFIAKGLVRYYYTDHEGREFTKMFFRENSLVSSYTAMINKRPSLITIQALTQTEILEINFEHWLRIKQSNDKWNLFLISLLEKGYAIKEKRERELLIYDAENRYKIFREDFQDMESKIKQNLIASYIGITPIALSRIRNKMGLINLC
jgi:CRP-like cAMP-binding protein